MEKVNKHNGDAEIREIKAEEDSELQKLLSQMPESMRFILEAAQRAARSSRAEPEHLPTTYHHIR